MRGSRVIRDFHLQVRKRRARLVFPAPEGKTPGTVYSAFLPVAERLRSRTAVSRWKQGTLNPHTGRDFVQFGKTESVLNKGAEKIAPLFNLFRSGGRVS